MKTTLITVLIIFLSPLLILINNTVFNKISEKFKPTQDKKAQVISQEIFQKVITQNSSWSTPDYNNNTFYLVFLPLVLLLLGVILTRSIYGTSSAIYFYTIVFSLFWVFVAGLGFFNVVYSKKVGPPAIRINQDFIEVQPLFYKWFNLKTRKQQIERNSITKIEFSFVDDPISGISLEYLKNIVLYSDSKVISLNMNIYSTKIIDGVYKFLTEHYIKGK